MAKTVILTQMGFLGFSFLINLQNTHSVLLPHYHNGVFMGRILRKEFNLVQFGIRLQHKKLEKRETFQMHCM